MVKRDKKLLALKTGLGKKDARLNRMKVLQQPDAGGAMHLWQVETDLALPVVREADQLLPGCFCIEE